MNYEILESHIIFKDGKLEEVAVLWVSNKTHGWVRASYCNTKPCSGYKFLIPRDTLSPELFQKVAGQGFNLPDNKKKIYFPGKHNWEE